MHKLTKIILVASITHSWVAGSTLPKSRRADVFKMVQKNLSTVPAAVPSSEVDRITNQIMADKKANMDNVHVKIEELTAPVKATAATRARGRAATPPRTPVVATPGSRTGTSPGTGAAAAAPVTPPAAAPQRRATPP